MDHTSVCPSTRPHVFMCLTFRFFSTCSSGTRTTDRSTHGADPPAPSPVPPIQTSETSDPPPSQSSTSPRRTSLRPFDRPSKSPSSEGLVKLEQKTSRSTGGVHPPCPEDSEDPPDSPLSQDSAYWSQSQPCPKEEPPCQDPAATVSSPLHLHVAV